MWQELISLSLLIVSTASSWEIDLTKVAVSSGEVVTTTQLPVIYHTGDVLSELIDEVNEASMDIHALELLLRNIKHAIMNDVDEITIPKDIDPKERNISVDVAFITFDEFVLEQKEDVERMLSKVKSFGYTNSQQDLNDRLLEMREQLTNITSFSKEFHTSNDHSSQTHIALDDLFYDNYPDFSGTGVVFENENKDLDETKMFLDSKENNSDAKVDLLNFHTSNDSDENSNEDEFRGDANVTFRGFWNVMNVDVAKDVVREKSDDYELQNSKFISRHVEASPKKKVPDVQTDEEGRQYSRHGLSTTALYSSKFYSKPWIWPTSSYYFLSSLPAIDPELFNSYQYDQNEYKFDNKEDNAYETIPMDESEESLSSQQPGIFVAIAVPVILIKLTCLIAYCRHKYHRPAYTRLTSRTIHSLPRSGTALRQNVRNISAAVMGGDTTLHGETTHSQSQNTYLPSYNEVVSNDVPPPRYETCVRNEGDNLNV